MSRKAQIWLMVGSYAFMWFMLGYAFYLNRRAGVPPLWYREPAYIKFIPALFLFWAVVAPPMIFVKFLRLTKK